jgi:hypothetical protein
MNLVKFFQAAEAVNDCFQADHKESTHPYVVNYLCAVQEANDKHGFYALTDEWCEEFRWYLVFCEDGRGADWV